MYKVVIIDDESKPREVLVIKIKEQCPMLDIVGTASSAQEGYELCQLHHPDLVFLDVNMPNESGFDFIRKYSFVPFEVIFATAHQEFAIEAFKAAAVGYLLKPIRNEELVIAVNNAIGHLSLRDSALKYDTLIHNIKPANQNTQKIVIPCNDRYEFIDVDQIILCESSDKYTFIYVNDGRKLLSSQYLGHFKAMLEEYGFFVPHKSYVVNIKFISSLTHEDEILMKSIDIKIPLARRRKAEFLQVMAVSKWK